MHAIILQKMLASASLRKLQPVKSAAGVAGYQQWEGGVSREGRDGGIGDEQHFIGSIQAFWIPKTNGVIITEPT